VELRLFLGDKGQVGIILKAARTGDFICQFLGCDSVAVLRSDPEDGSYKLVSRRTILKTLNEDRTSARTESAFADHLQESHSRID
jgi:hypothetical protein